MCRRYIYLASLVLVLGLVLTSVAKGVDPNLVGWWQFDETSGTTAFDSSGGGFDGTINGSAGWNPSGRIGGCMSFDG